MPGAGRFLAGVVLALALACAPSATRAEVPAPALELSLDQARGLATVALRQGQPGLARDLAMGLLQADAEDPYAYAVLARAHSRLGDPKLARAAARLSYRYAKDPADKYRAARDAGRLAFVQNRPTMSQIWLRRAALHASGPAEEAALARDYRVARIANRWSLRVDARLSPSDNVNNGSNTALEIINGEPTLGLLGPSSQALSGTVGIFDMAVGYRLRASNTSVTTLGHRLYARQVRLSSSARAAAPSADADDYASTYADVSLKHAFALGAKGNSAVVGAAVGAAWTGGDKAYDFLRLEALRKLRLGEARTLTFSGAIEQRSSTQGPSRDQDLARIGIEYSQKLARGDRLTLSYSLQEVDSDTVNSDYTTGSLRAEYRFAKALGPAQVSAALTLGQSDFDAYQLVAPVAGGREDSSVFGDITFFFADYDYAGFAPSLRLRTGRRSSNISRFETRETSLSVEIRSKF